MISSGNWASGSWFSGSWASGKKVTTDLFVARLKIKLLLLQQAVARIVWFSTLMTIFAGCSQWQMGQVSSTKRQEFISYHLDQAQQQINLGAYHQAMTHIDLLQMASPQNSHYHDNKRDLQNLITQHKHQLLKKSQQTDGNNRHKESYQLLLQALSLDPADDEIISKLQNHWTRQLQLEQSRKQAKYAVQEIKPSPGKPQSQSAKAAPEEVSTDPLAVYRSLYRQQQYQALVDAVAASKPVEVPQELEGWLMESHLKMAIRLLDQAKLQSALTQAEKAAAYNSTNENSTNHALPQIKALQKALSLALYEQSKGLVRTDINKTVQLLKLAAEHDRQNIQIKNELLKAQRIKNNLERIKALN